MAEHSDNLRASDGDRQAVAEKLRAALDEGRLDLGEYDERLAKAYAAKTYGDLKGLLVDLPPVTPVAHSQMQTASGSSTARTDDPEARGTTTKWIAGMWSGWLSTAVIMVAIWAISSAASGHLNYFWPIWVIGPWGAVLLASTVSGIAGSQPRVRFEREARRRARRIEERQRRRGRY